MARSLSLRLSWRWLLPLGWAGVQACSSRIDLPPRIGLGADGGGGASASSHLGGRGGVAGLTGLTVGGAPAAVFDAAGSGEGGDATSVASGGRSGSGAAGAAGAAGVPDPSADPAAAGVTGEGPPPECGALGSWVEGAAVFARNGAIVPLDIAAGMALHYFPKAGGEFFLLEGDIADYSQVHAAPALDIMRLQIESKKDRDYQWVVHHVERPASVEFGGRQYREVAAFGELADRTWFHDAARKNLHVKVKVQAGEDCIINLNFE